MRYQVEHSIVNSVSTSSPVLFCFFCINILMTTFLTIFPRFSNTFWRFQKISSPKLVRRPENNSEHFQKISEDLRGAGKDSALVRCSIQGSAVFWSPNIWLGWLSFFPWPGQLVVVTRCYWDEADRQRLILVKENLALDLGQPWNTFVIALETPE